jgi:hypothetical protein
MEKGSVHNTIMKYLSIMLVIVLFAGIGCIGSSPYKEVTPSDLIRSPQDFEGRQVCINGILENNSISGIKIGTTATDLKDGTSIRACGAYENENIKPDSVNTTLSLNTEKEIYHSNETLKVFMDFNSPATGNSDIQVSGINNMFDTPLVSDKKNVRLEKGNNRIDFEFKTPSCEECSALKPDMYFINASVSLGGKIYEAYTKITIERETK